MRRGVAVLLGIVATGVIGIDVAGLAGAFGYPKYDAGAKTIPTSTTPSGSGNQGVSSSSSPPSGSTSPSSSGASTTPSSSTTQPSSIPSAIPVPSGAIPTSPIGNGSDVTTIGDSVMVDAQPYLAQLLPGIVVDGKVSRQLISTPPVIRQLKTENKLNRYVVIELGTNGPFTAAQLKKLMHQVGKGHGFVLVNTSDPLPWESQVNKVIDQVAASYPHTILVNWNQKAPNVAQYFYPDHVHLMPQGAKYFATLVAKAVLKLQQQYPPSSSQSP